MGTAGGWGQDVNRKKKNNIGKLSLVKGLISSPRNFNKRRCVSRLTCNLWCVVNWAVSLSNLLKQRTPIPGGNTRAKRTSSLAAARLSKAMSHGSMWACLAEGVKIIPCSQHVYSCVLVWPFQYWSSIEDVFILPVFLLSGSCRNLRRKKARKKRSDWRSRGKGEKGTKSGSARGSAAIARKRRRGRERGTRSGKETETASGRGSGRGRRSASGSAKGRGVETSVKAEADRGQWDPWCPNKASPCICTARESASKHRKESDNEHRILLPADL